MRPASRRTLWLLYSAFILYAGTIPFHFAGDGDALIHRWDRFLSTPFISPDTGRRPSIPDVVQNILLFVPFGVLGVSAASTGRSWTWGRIAWITSLGALLSLSVESLQLLMRDRTASTGDVLTNTAGTLAGGTAARWVMNLAALAATRLRREGMTDVTELRTLTIAAGALVIAFLQPFDVTLEVGVVTGHIRAFEANPWQFTGLRDEGIVLLIASLFAMALASYIRALGEDRAGSKAVALGVPAVCALEASQVMLGSRMPGLWDAAVGSAGILTGAALWAASSRIPSPRLWQGLLISLTGIAAAIQMLSPFEIAAEYRGFAWFPFAAYYNRTTFETLSHVIELALAYFPLGFCIPLGIDSPRRALLVVLGTALAIAVPIEYLQGWVVGRYPDVSDIGLSLAGAWAGWRLATEL